MILFLFVKNLYITITLPLLSSLLTPFQFLKAYSGPQGSMIKEQHWVCRFIINQILITSVLSWYSSYGDCQTEHCLWHNYIRHYIQSMPPETRKSYCLWLATRTKLLIRAAPQFIFKEGSIILTHLCKVLWELGIKIVLCKRYYCSQNMAWHPCTFSHSDRAALAPAIKYQLYAYPCLGKTGKDQSRGGLRTREEYNRG